MDCFQIRLHKDCALFILPFLFYPLRWSLSPNSFVVENSVWTFQLRILSVMCCCLLVIPSKSGQLNAIVDIVVIVRPAFFIIRGWCTFKMRLSFLYVCEKHTWTGGRCVWENDCPCKCGNKDATFSCTVCLWHPLSGSHPQEEEQYPWTKKEEILLSKSCSGNQMLSISASDGIKNNKIMCKYANFSITMKEV